MLSTETRNPRTTHIDRMSTAEILRAMNAENYRVPQAVEEALWQISPLVDHIAERMREGGRMLYVGAGTSGRLGMLDAAECPPTFGVPPECVIAIIAGGPDTMFHADAACEDDADRGSSDIERYSLTKNDTVIGLSAAGGARYVLGALRTAKNAGAATAGVCCNADTPLLQLADFPICADTGPEAITGSTRLKAGSAQKIILNLISTAVMIKQGTVYENFMIALDPANDKLLLRAVSVVCALTGCTQKTAESALAQAGDVRAAVEALRNGEKRP